MPVFDSLLQVVAACDSFPYEINSVSSQRLQQITPIILGPHTVGNVLSEVLPSLKEYNSRFDNDKSPFVITEKHITFNTWVNTPEQRTEAVKILMDTWRTEKAFAVLSGWRNELYPVYGDADQVDNVAFVMERAATPLFGISTFGCHMNAFTKNEQGELFMWVARRSMSKQTYPGLLDNCVAGGISFGYGIRDTIVKECDEEASIPEHLANQAKSVGVVTYYTVTEGGLQPETEYIFDLQLPQDFKPTPRDGEVDCFYLWPLEKVKETILNNEWKGNCAVVAIDFMMRHGYITPDEEPHYIDISYRVHRNLPFPTPRKGLNK